MDTRIQIENQFSIEEHFNARLIKDKIREIYDEENAQEALSEAVELVQEFLQGKYYPSKNKRLEKLSKLNMMDVVRPIMEHMAFFTKPELFTSASSQLACILDLETKLPETSRLDSIKTVAELLALMEEIGLYTIFKESKYASLKVVSNLELPEDLIKDIENSAYMPPMVCTPLPLKTNQSNAYLTDKGSSLILGGKENHHDGDICLDVLNTMNRVALSLNVAFLSSVEEEATEVSMESIIEAAEKRGRFLSKPEAKERLETAKDNWQEFKTQSYEMYSLMVNHGNEFYLTHKVDKRGRIYASGYHISTQGTAFKKASLEFAKKEIVEVPEEFK